MTSTDLLSICRKNPIGVICGIVTLLSGAFLYYRSDVIDETKSQLDDLSMQAQTMLANVRNSAGLLQQTELIKQSAKQLETRLIKATQLATNLQYFYRLESDTGIKLTDIRQNQVGRAGTGLYVGIPYMVTFQGNFSQVLGFLQRIESGKHFSKFNSVSFNKTAGATAGMLNVSMNIELLGTP